MKNLKLRGWQAVAAVALLFAIGGSNILLPTTAVDERGSEPVRNWLTLKIGGEINQQFEGVDATNISAAQSNELAAQTAAMNQIEIASIEGRRAGKDRMIVRAEFRAGRDAPKQTIYLEMRTRTVGSWEVRRETSIWRWRMNIFGGF
ncbi:hypothetical protein DRQ53_01750 [bacterium]|nr:MAG: hypothetical protein DRQ53_01750 [bacterium]